VDLVIDFVNQDYLGFLSLDVDLMLDLVLHLRGFGEVGIDLAIHQERPASRGAGMRNPFVRTI
jgi:hypothetical protein